MINTRFQIRFTLVSLFTKFHLSIFLSSEILTTSSVDIQATHDTNSVCLDSFKAEVLNLMLDFWYVFFLPYFINFRYAGTHRYNSRLSLIDVRPSVAFFKFLLSTCCFFKAGTPSDGKYANCFDIFYRTIEKFN